jgi:hypothetical protein
MFRPLERFRAAEQGRPAARDGRTLTSKWLVGFALTLGWLVGSIRPETAPVTVGGEEGGGWLRRPQCLRAGGSASQCTCTGASTGCGWRRLCCLDSRRGGGQWGAQVSSDRRRQRARRGGSELRPSECEGGVIGASGGPIGACTPGGLAGWALACWARCVALATTGARPGRQ